MFTSLQQIIDAYQNSVLCKTTRLAKESGEWYKKEYTDNSLPSIEDARLLMQE